MREFLLYGVALPFVLWWAYKAFSAALTLVRRDAKEAAALALARKGGPFAVAYSTIKTLDGKIPSTNPWQREENQRGVS